MRRAAAGAALYALVFICLFVLPSALLCAQEGGAGDFVSRGRAEDAAFDRGLLASRADTLRQGDWTVQSYEVVFLGASVGITDALQLSLTVAPLFGEDWQGPLIVNVRHVLGRGARWVGSAQVELVLLPNGEEPAGATAGVLLADWRPNEVFGLYAQAGAQRAFLGEGAWSLRGVVGASAAISRRWALLLEGWALQGGLGARAPELDAAARVIFYGARYHRAGFALDLGMIYTPLILEEQTLGGLGLPWLVLTWR